MNRIIVQNNAGLSKSRTFETILIFIVVIIFVVLHIYFVTLSIKFLILTTILNSVISPLLARSLKQTEKEYVAELLISHTEIIIVYKRSNNTTRNVAINLHDIISFRVSLLANIIQESRFLTTQTKTRVLIKTKSNNITFFVKNRPANYSLMLQLLNFQTYIPNFLYAVNGNDEGIKSDVRYYAKYGKQLSLIQKQLSTFNNLPTATRINIILKNIVMLYWSFYLIICFIPCVEIEILFKFLFTGLGVMLFVPISYIFIKHGKL